MIKIEKANGKYPDVYITSDSHFSHKNICRGVTDWRTPEGKIPIEQTRDFETIEKMNSTIVDNINKVVSHDDILIHLGDWSFGGFDQIKSFWNRLVCKNIHIVLGNHDHHILKNKDGVRGLFKSVSEYNPLIIGDHTFKLFHFPISSWDDLNKGSMHLHGHSHLPTDFRFGVGRRMDVGMDGHPEFRPYHIMDEITPLLMERPIKSDIVDHHTKDFKK